MPQSSACFAGMRLERMTMSLVRVMPTIFCKPRRAAGAGNLTEPLLRQRVEAGLRRNAEIAGERDFEADAEAIAAIGGDHWLCAARRRGDVPGELRHVLGRGFQEALDVAAAGKMLADGAQHDHAYARRLRRAPRTRAASWSRCGISMMLSGGRSRITSARSRSGIDLDAEAVELGETRVGESHRSAHAASYPA